MQNKPNFSNNPMNINPVMTSYYKQKTPPGPLPKQTQSNPNKPNPASVFDPKIGFEHTKSVSNGRNCLYFLRIFTKKYTLLEQILLLLNSFSHFLLPRLADKKKLPISPWASKLVLLFDDQICSKMLRYKLIGR